MCAFDLFGLVGQEGNMVTIGEFLVSHAWQLVLMVLLLGCAAFFSGAETAFFSLSPGQMFSLDQDRRRLARLVPVLMQRPGDVLTAVLLGTNIVHILYFICSTVLIVDIQGTLEHGSVWAVVTTAVTFLGIVVLGEVLPKTVAYIWSRRLAPMAAGPLAVFVGLTRPIQRFLAVVVIKPITRLFAPSKRPEAGLTQEELATLLTLSKKRGVITTDENELLQELLELTDLRAGDIMVPRVDMVACDVNSSTQELLELVRKKHVTRIPVYEGDLDHIVGVVHAKRILVEPERPIREVISPIQFVPISAPLEKVLIQLRAKRSQIAIVVDEYGGTAGLITLEEIVEEIVGDIAEGREEPAGPLVRRVGPNEWLVDGDLPIHEWAEAFPTDLGNVRFRTVGGLVVSILGHIPQVGEQARYRNVIFTVEAMRRRRVGLLRMRLQEPQS